MIVRIFVACCMLIFCTNNALAGDTNDYNPYLNERLPSQSLSNDAKEMAESIGAKKTSLQDEAGHRQYWRQEVYPIVFGNAKSENEVLVFIDYANPKSENIWAEILKVAKSLDVQQNKIVVFAKNSEQYGTELTGGGIWIAHSRSAYAMDYFNYSLRRWNETKRTLAARGISRAFVYEYDATAKSSDFPILYSYLKTLKPAIPASDFSKITKYAFNAGNVNSYQASLAAEDYDVETFPAVVVNGDVVTNPTAQNILNALK